MTPRSMIDEFKSAYPGYSRRVTRRVTAILYSDWQELAFEEMQEISFGEYIRRAHGYVSAVISLAVKLEDLG